MSAAAASAGWDRAGLTARGFEGFVPFADLDRGSIPSEPGVYAVVRPDDRQPTFLPTSPAGWFKAKDPTVAADTLRSAWVEGAPVVYIGKAAAGVSRRRGLRARLWEYRRHGFGAPVGHWGGRYVWQLQESHDLLVAWMPTPGTDPAVVEGELITEFVQRFGRRPFANRVGGRR